MKKYKWQEDEGPGDVQVRQDYLGMSWDRQLSCGGTPLQPLETFPWFDYQEVSDVDGGRRNLTVSFPLGGRREIQYESYDDLAFLLQQVPGIEVMRDDGPPAPSPASGSGYLFFRAEGAKADDVAANVGALLAALRTDLEELWAKHPNCKA